MQSTTPPGSICILRLSALGDATHVLPLVKTIRDRWPGTRITWIIGKLEHRLVCGIEGVEFLVHEKSGGTRAAWKLRKQLAGRHFDVLLHMQVSARANLLSRLIRSDIRLGWDRARSRDFHQWFIDQEIAAVPYQHQVQGFLEFARALGLDPGAPRWDLPIADEALRWAERHIDAGQRTIVISPCSSHPLRNWGAANYALLADFAIRELGARVVLSGGPGKQEAELAQSIERCMRQRCLNLVGRDTLEQAKAMLRLADLLVSPDSGPVHIASALGTPVLGLYAATWSRRSGPYNSLGLCVDRFPEAARRFRKREPEELRWGTRIEVPGVMDLVTPEAVMQRLSEWWQQRTSAAAPKA